MKKLNISSDCQDVTAAVSLFNKILEESNYNLNRFVNGVTLSIDDDDESKTLGEMVQEFIEVIVSTVKNIDDPETFWESFMQLDDYEKNDRFIEWIKGYTNSVIKPYKEAEIVRSMDAQEFRNVTKYCFENMILQDIGRRKVQEQKNWEQIIVLKKVFLTFIDMTIVNNLSRENALYNMGKLFGIDEEKSEIWWELVIENEDKLWKIMMMKKYDQIENKLDFLLNGLEEANIMKG